MSIRFESPPERKRWLGALLQRLPILLGDFAHAAEVSVTTLAKGDDAFTIELRKESGMAALLDFVSHTDDILSIYASLSLLLENREHQTMELEHGAGLWINVELTEAGTLDLEREAPVYLHLALDVDIYAPRSWGLVRDNAVMAAINAPRLAGFLERLERDVPSSLLDIHTERYRGMVGPRGFIGPTSAPGGEREHAISPMPWRDPSPAEQALLDRLCSVPFIGREVVREQVRGAKVRVVDTLGSIEFDVPPQEGATPDHRAPVEAQAKDRDGESILALLHVVDGRLSELQLIKPLSSKILELPRPDQWSVSQLDW